VIVDRPQERIETPAESSTVHREQPGDEVARDIEKGLEVIETPPLKTVALDTNVDPLAEIALMRDKTRNEHFLTSCREQMRKSKIIWREEVIDGGKMLTLESAQPFFAVKARKVFGSFLASLATKFKEVVLNCSVFQSEDELSLLGEILSRARKYLAHVRNQSVEALKDAIQIRLLSPELEAELFRLQLMDFCVGVDVSLNKLPRRFPVEDLPDPPRPIVVD
jgi:hypothetical protein